MLHQGVSQATPQELETLLLGLLDPRHVAEATQKLTNFLADISSVPPLIDRLQNSENVEVRNLSAVYLRTKLTSYYKQIDKATVSEFKARILACLENEKVPKVLRAIGQLIVKVAKCYDWKEDLLNRLFMVMQKGTSIQQEVALTCMRNMVLLTDGDPFTAYKDVFVSGLKSGNERMMYESLKGLQALGMIHAYEEDKKDALKEIYGMMAECCNLFVVNKDEKIARYVLEMWSDMFSEGCLQGFESQIYEFMLTIGSKKELPVNVRYMVVDFMKMYAKQLPNRLIKDNLLTRSMEFCITLLMENYEETTDDISTPLNMAIEVMDGIFLNVRVDHTAKLALSGVEKLVEQSRFKSALALLAIMAEGCSEELRKPQILPELYKLLEAQMSNPNPAVRKVAYEALTQFVYHISPEMNDYDERLMPAIFTCLQNEMNNQENLEACCITLDSYTAVLENKLKPYVHQILTVLKTLLSKGSSDVQEAAISAISSTLMTARDANVSVPELPKLVDILLQIISQANQEDVLKMRAEATNCLGEVCLTVGPAQTLQLDQKTKFINTIIEGCKLDSTELREFTFNFFGTLAKLFEDKLLTTPQFQTMFQLVCNCLDDEDGLKQVKNDDGFGDSGAPGVEEEPEALDEDELFTNTKYYCATGFLEEKTAAAVALEMFARHCGPAYQNFWEESITRIIDCMTYPHQTLKQQITRCFHAHIESIFKTCNAGMCTNQKTQATAQEFVSMVVTLYMISIVREDDRDCCVETIISLSRLLKLDAQTLLGLKGRDPDEAVNANGESESCWVEFMEISDALFQESTPCQTPDDVELDVAKKQTEDNVILDALTDLTSALAASLTERQLTLFWKQTFPHLERYLAKHRSHIEYSLAIGCMGDVSAKLSPKSIAPFLENSVKMAFQGLNSSQHHLVRQNSVYALGCLCRAGQASMQPYIKDIFSHLNSLCNMPRGQADKKDRLLRDNAYSTLGSLLAYVPLPDNDFVQLFGVFIQGIPVEDDFPENQFVAGAIIRILDTKQNIIQQALPMVQQILHNSLTWKEMPDQMLLGIQKILGGKNETAI